MKLHDVRYLVREGFRNTWHNRLMAFASVGVLVCCLLLTGFAYMVFVNINHLFQTAYEQNVVAVYLERTLEADEVNRLGDELRSTDNVASVEFRSKDEMLDLYAGEMGPEAFEGLREDNPLQDTYIVSLTDLEQLDDTVKVLKSKKGVEEVTYDGDIAQMLTRVRGLVLGIGGIVIVVLLIVSLFIISNTIKLTVHNRRLEIYIMKSVGATDGFVRFPFVVEGMVLGVFSGAVSYGMLWALYTSLVQNFSTGVLWKLVPFDEVWLPILIGFMVGGTLIGVSGSAISMSRYLKREGSLRI